MVAYTPVDPRSQFAGHQAAPPRAPALAQSCAPEHLGVLDPAYLEESTYSLECSCHWLVAQRRDLDVIFRFAMAVAGP